MTKGVLRIIGTGIRPRRQLTPEAAKAIQASERLLYLIPDPDEAEYIASMAGGESENAAAHYQSDVPLAKAYDAMIGRVMSWIDDGKQSCFALYGHPGVIVYPTHRLLRIAREKGHDAVMLPAISAEDCLFADLGVDPASVGCQTFWATDLLLNRRLIDPTMATVIWSIGVVGCFSYSSVGMSPKALLALLDRLYLCYPPTHRVVVYEAAVNDNANHRADLIPLSLLPTVPLDGSSTLYIPPALPTVPEWQQYSAFEFPYNAATELFQANPPLTN